MNLVVTGVISSIAYNILFAVINNSVIGALGGLVVFYLFLDSFSIKELSDKKNRRTAVAIFTIISAVFIL